MQIDPRFYKDFLNGVTCYQHSQYPQAITHFLLSLTKLPNRPYHHSIQHPQIIPDLLAQFTHSLQLPPTESLSNLSSCLIKTKQYQQAQTICSFLFKLNPYISLPYYNMASIFIRQEKYHDAVGMIRCAISCEFLRKYERLFEKQALDNAIHYAHNNLNAIKYRISHNLQFLNFTKKTSIQYEDINQSIQKVIDELQKDNQTYNKFKKIYEVKFYDQNQPQNQNFFISNLKPPFVLQSHYQEIQDLGSQKQIERKLAFMKELKDLRSLYMELLDINEAQMDISLFIEDFIMENATKSIYQTDQRLEEEDYSEKSIYQQYDMNNLIEENCSRNHTVTLQTSCELQDSFDMVNPFKLNPTIKNQVFTCSTIKAPVNRNLKNTYSHNRTINTRPKVPSEFSLTTNKNLNKTLKNPPVNHQNVNKNKENIKFTQNQQKSTTNYLQKTTLISLRSKHNKLQVPASDYKYINEATEEQELKTSRNNRPTVQSNCTNSRKNSCESNCVSSFYHEKQQLNSSIICILDYDTNSPRMSINNNCPKNEPDMIESITVYPPKQFERHQDHRHTVDHSEFHMVKNRSHENLFNSNIKLDSSKIMSHSRYHNQDSGLTINGNPHLKLLGCSKCSVDHATGEETVPKNVKLNINLTEIYNYPGDISQVQTFITVKHLSQSYRTQFSKGKFPNWKHPLTMKVQNLEEIASQDPENRKVKIQLWAKSIKQKKDSSHASIYGQQLVGEQTIDLKDEKWVKKKIVLENGDKKAAYMYISMEKIHKKE